MKHPRKGPKVHGQVYLILYLFLSLTACASYQSKVEQARNFIQVSQFAQAEEILKPLADKENDDQLIYLLDYATCLHLKKDFKTSNEYFFKAEKLADQLDYISISRVTGSILFNEEMVQYKGDTFEKVFMNAYLALNYLELNLLDDALVEARKINEKYLKFKSEEKKDFELNPFAKYLSALIWEADQKYDDAYLAYKEAHRISSSIGGIAQDLIRSAKKAQRMDEYKKWKTQFPDVKEDPTWYDRNLGELVVFYHQGWGPRKQPDPGSPRFPILQPVFSESQTAVVELESNQSNENKYATQSEISYDVQSAAMQTLMDDRSALVARRVGGIVAKEVLADQIRQKNELAGFFTWIFLHATDRADLRQWSTLPQTIQTIRLRLKPGEYKFKIKSKNWNQQVTEESDEKTIKISAGKKVFLNWRSFK